jgi:hypothetical protein
MRDGEKLFPAVAQRRAEEGKGGEDKGGTLETIENSCHIRKYPICNEPRFAWQQSPSASRFFVSLQPVFFLPSA